MIVLGIIFIIVAIILFLFAYFSYKESLNEMDIDPLNKIIMVGTIITFGTIIAFIVLSLNALKSIFANNSVTS